MSRLTFLALLNVALPLLADSVKCPTANTIVVATADIFESASTFCLACEKIVVTAFGGSVCTSSNAQAVTTTLTPLSTSTFGLGLSVYPESILSGSEDHTISSLGPEASTSGDVATAYEAYGPGVVTAVSSNHVSDVAAAAPPDTSVSGATNSLSEAIESSTAPDVLGAAVTASMNPYYHSSGGAPPFQVVSSAVVGSPSSSVSSASSPIPDGGGMLPSPMQNSTTVSGRISTSTGSVQGQSILSTTIPSSSLAVYTGTASNIKAAVWSIGVVLGAVACWI